MLLLKIICNKTTFSQACYDFFFAEKQAINMIFVIDTLTLVRIFANCFLAKLFIP